MPSWLTLKLGAMILGATAILSFVLLAFHWKHQAADRGEKLAVICQQTRDASGQPKLKCSEVAQQIKFMGEAIGTLTQAIHKQNDAVAAMGAETKRQQAESDRATKAAQTRAASVMAAAQHLNASARSVPLKSAQCEPSDALKGAWQ